MDYGWQTILGNEEWRNIPNTQYDISNKGRIRRFYNYLGKVISPHYTYIKPDGNNIRLQNNGGKYGVRRKSIRNAGIQE